MTQLAMRSTSIRMNGFTVFNSGALASLDVFWKPAKMPLGALNFNKEPGKTPPNVNTTPQLATHEAVYPLSIMVVEDNRINRMLTLKMLTHLGYSSDAVFNGRECIEAMAHKTYDLYLMDLQMPIMDGFTAAREIRRWHQVNPVSPRPYICALTANVMAKDREECMAAGMDDFLPKPLRLESLKVVVSRVAEHLKSKQERQKQ